jgi:hypothetical protein
MLTPQRQLDIQSQYDRLGSELIGLDYQAIADAINTRPLIPNPEPQQQVPAGNISAATADISDELTATDIKAITAANAQIAALRALGSGLGGFAELSHADLIALLIKKGLSIKVADRLKNELEKTQSDPNWPSQVPGPAMISPPVSAEEIQAYVCMAEQAEHDADQPRVEAELEALRAETERAAIEAQQAIDAAAMQAAMAIAFETPLDDADREVA